MGAQVAEVRGAMTATTSNITLVDHGSPHKIRMQRRNSSPLAPPFMVSAPGKVIVSGEHAVVYGKVCLHIPLRIVQNVLSSGAGLTTTMRASYRKAQKKLTGNLPR